jgi:F-type H+-transporting ATPase subunit b
VADGEVIMRNGRLFLCALVAFLTLAWASTGTGTAAEKQGGEHSAAAKEGHGEAEKEAQPPIFTPVRIDLAVWTLVVFLLLLFVLSKYAWGPMLEGLRKREEHIHAAIDEAQKAREEAQQLREHLAQERAKIADEMRAHLDQARRDAQQLRDNMQAQAKADINAERERLHREVNTARDQALKQLWDQAAQLATLVSAKVIRRQLGPDDHRRLVDEALADLGKTGDKRYPEVS